MISSGQDSAKRSPRDEANACFIVFNVTSTTQNIGIHSSVGQGTESLKSRKVVYSSLIKDRSETHVVLDKKQCC